jgi:hypothetical protein
MLEGKPHGVSAQLAFCLAKHACINSVLLVIFSHFICHHKNCDWQLPTVTCKFGPRSDSGILEYHSLDKYYGPPAPAYLVSSYPSVLQGVCGLRCRLNISNMKITGQESFVFYMVLFNVTDLLLSVITCSTKQCRELQSTAAFYLVSGLVLGMFCPKCGSRLVEKTKVTVFRGEIRGWACRYCSKFYKMSDLKRSILSA